MLASRFHESPPRSAQRQPHRPWWIPHVLGSVPDIEPRLLRLLGLVALALFFEQYDLSMLTAALRFIAEDLGIAESELGGYMSLIRLGSLPAFAVIPFADRIGRRRLFLISVVGTSVGTLLTALSQNASQFVAVQLVTRTFLATGMAVAVVIVTEEFPAPHRGWGIGMLGALSACGHGLGAALFAAIHVLPYGWRALYAVGIAPVLLLRLFLRNIHETRRFEEHRAQRVKQGEVATGLRGWLRPMASLARTHPLRALAVGLVGGLGAFGSMPVMQFVGYFTQAVHGWAPWQFSAMVFFGGGIGIIGNVAAGRLGDRIGRRVVGVTCMILYPLCAWIFYRGPGWSLPFVWIVLVLCQTAGDAIIRALSTELFPTSHRGTSAGWLAAVATLGAAAGLGMVGAGTRQPGDLARMISLMAFATLPGALCLLLLPETRGRELETISDEAE